MSQTWKMPVDNVGIEERERCEVCGGYGFLLKDHPIHKHCVSSAPCEACNSTGKKIKKNANGGEE